MVEQKRLDRPELREIQRLWCQHCKSMQKTNDTIVECWYNPLDDEGGNTAFCAANEDACKVILALIPDIEPLDKFYLRVIEDKMEEAKAQERERIIKILEGWHLGGYDSERLQALKEENGKD